MLGEVGEAAAVVAPVVGLEVEQGLTQWHRWHALLQSLWLVQPRVQTVTASVHPFPRFGNPRGWGATLRYCTVPRVLQLPTNQHV